MERREFIKAGTASLAGVGAALGLSVAVSKTAKAAVSKGVDPAQGESVTALSRVLKMPGKPPDYEPGPEDLDFCHHMGDCSDCPDQCNHEMRGANLLLRTTYERHLGMSHLDSVYLSHGDMLKLRKQVEAYYAGVERYIVLDGVRSTPGSMGEPSFGIPRARDWIAEEGDGYVWTAYGNEGCVYRWDIPNLGPNTNDPRFKDMLVSGTHNHVSLNGKELTYPEYAVTAFRTGPDGWVELRHVPMTYEPVNDPNACGEVIKESYSRENLRGLVEYWVTVTAETFYDLGYQTFPEDRWQFEAQLPQGTVNSGSFPVLELEKLKGEVESHRKQMTLAREHMRRLLEQVTCGICRHRVICRDGKIVMCRCLYDTLRGCVNEDVQLTINSGGWFLPCPDLDHFCGIPLEVLEYDPPYYDIYGEPCDPPGGGI